MSYISMRQRKDRVWPNSWLLGFGGKRDRALLPLRGVWQAAQPEHDQALTGTQTAG